LRARRVGIRMADRQNGDRRGNGSDASAMATAGSDGDDDPGDAIAAGITHRWCGSQPTGQRELDPARGRVQRRARAAARPEGRQHRVPRRRLRGRGHALSCNRRGDRRHADGNVQRSRDSGGPTVLLQVPLRRRAHPVGPDRCHLRGVGAADTARSEDVTHRVRRCGVVGRLGSITLDIPRVASPVLTHQSALPDARLTEHDQVVTRVEHGERLAKLRIPTDDPGLNRHTVSVSTPDDRVKHTSRRWRGIAVLPCRAGRPGVGGRSLACCQYGRAGSTP
jgi:hypothetical protein